MGRAHKNEITDDQMRALQNIIAISPDMTTLAKKALIWLLQKSENLSKPVCVSFADAGSEKIMECGDQTDRGVGALYSSVGITRIDLVLAAMGSPVKISHHGGHYMGGKFVSCGPTRTIWISPERYDDGAEQIPLSMKAIKAVKPPSYYGTKEGLSDNWRNSRK